MVRLHLSRVVDGMLFQTFVQTKEGVSVDALHTYANDLNRQALVVRFFIDKDGDFACEAWYPGPYDTSSIEQFMQAWHHDLLVLIQHEDSSSMLS